MAKNLKLTIKNTQIAQAVNLSGIKSKLASKKAGLAEETEEKVKESATKTTAVKSSGAKISGVKATAKTAKSDSSEPEAKTEAPRIKARSRSAFAEPLPGEAVEQAQEHLLEFEPEVIEEQTTSHALEEIEDTSSADLGSLSGRRKTSQELRKEIFGEEIEDQKREQQSTPAKNPLLDEIVEPVTPPAPLVEKEVKHELPKPVKPKRPASSQATIPNLLPSIQKTSRSVNPYARDGAATPAPKLGPTGRHISELAPPPRPPQPKTQPREDRNSTSRSPANTSSEADKAKARAQPKEGEAPAVVEDADKKGVKGAKFKEFRDIKPAKQTTASRFDARDRQGLRDGDEEQSWRKRRAPKHRIVQEEITRPTSLKINIPISLKDLAVEMKLKASQLITKLFAQGVAITLNDLLEDETTIQLLGHEFGCEISIDRTKEDRIRITDKTIKEEIAAANPENIITRPPVVAFMGHVDHGKTSLIDAIRKSNRASGEAGAITQHIGAFRFSTPVGDITFLDTPGHEAFSAMRARGADVTDIVVLVVAGDEGMRQQTIEALQHAKSAKVTIVVAINKCDKPNFNAENVYRQLSENELLPEAWGGQTITINCSAVTGEGIPQLLEMLALQAEVLELKSDPTMRARGSVLESEMHKGMGSIATVLVQNGTLRIGDAVVFTQLWGRIKTMRDEMGRELKEAGPSTPVEITGLSGLPEAGQEFIVVKNEKEAREIAEARMLGMKQFNLLQTKKLSMENLFQQAAETNKKILNVILRADVQGSLEALKAALMKIESKKAELNIIFAGVGEISESDVQLAAASKALIVGFHTQIESHADQLIKQVGVQTRLHNIIYHAIDDVKEILSGLLDKIAIETEQGKAEVKATFKSSHHGLIAGCQVIEGSIKRKDPIRIKRGNEVIWKGSISSLKRVKEDVREVTKGLECGILLNNFNDAMEGDIIESYEITYITQEL